ncbi:MAG: MFS transporter [Ilumatobacter sp.]|uniref:MFS transporter n=1 Tax=Ilumatobacter sp. TaxID=1967498 RepID=UPI0026069922|nr:MFS transporter [Ilumatobacter sp.]MDJ0767503.1 MFS transporter [Ilumatobacter sp.]
MTAPPQRVMLPLTLLVTMTASAYQIFVFAVLASPLIDDLDLSRTQIGVVGSINTAVGATTALLTGPLTDRIGARRSVVLVLAISAVGMAAMGVAPNVWWLGVAAVIGGIPQGWGNPATNAVISSRVPAGRRGSVTGIKQSGVTLGVFLSGATMPIIASTWNWRVSVWFYAALFALIAIVAHATLDRDPAAAATAPTDRRSIDAPAVPGRTSVDRRIVRLAAYALLMGTAGGAVGRFFPLFAEESVGFSLETAGLLTALAGLLGMGVRVLVGRWAETWIAPTRLLGLLSAVGVVYCLSLAAATPSTSWLLWISPPLSAIGIAAWNAVAMLAVITFVAVSQAGRASGVVMLGFLGGLTISAPIAGVVVDQTGDYRPVWLIAAALAAAAAALMLVTTPSDDAEHVHPEPTVGT